MADQPTDEPDPETVYERLFELLDGTYVERFLADYRSKSNITEQKLKSVYELGTWLYNEYQLKEAEAVFSSYAMLNPYDHRGPGALASIALERKEYQKALQLLNTVKAFPACDFDETCLNMAYCHFNLEEYALAAAMNLLVNPDQLNGFYLKRHQDLQEQLEPYKDGQLLRQQLEDLNLEELVGDLDIDERFKFKFDLKDEGEAGDKHINEL